MQGLKRLVDMRGGLGSLETKPMVMTKVFRYEVCELFRLIFVLI